MHVIFTTELHKFFFETSEMGTGTISYWNWSVYYCTCGIIRTFVRQNKLRVYRELKEVFECKKYLYGVPDMGSKLLFRFRSGTHGLNEELGRHITRNICKAYVFCNCDCESSRICFVGVSSL